MMTKITSIVAVLALAAITANAAVLNATEDMRIRPASTSSVDAGTGTDVKLQAGDSVDLFRFDFTNATLPIASGSLVVKLAGSQTAVNSTLTAYVLELANDGWGEGKSSWNNQVQSVPTQWASTTVFGNPPTGNAVVAGSLAGSYNPGDVVTIPLDVTLLNGMRTGTYSKSIALFCTSGREIRVITSEASADQPYLDVTLVPEPATLSVLGLGALALVRRRRD